MIKASIEQEDFIVEFDSSGKVGEINSKSFEWDVLETGENSASIIYNGKSYNLVVEDIENGEAIIRINGKKVDVKTRDKMAMLLESMGLNTAAEQKVNQIKAPMPGLVLRILVEPGSQVEKGEGLLVLEAMKMENMIKSPVDAVVSSIPIQLGQAVDKNQVLVEFE